MKSIGMQSALLATAGTALLFAQPPGGGFGGPGGPGGPPPAFKPPPENATLDPFAGEKDPNKALLHKLLAVPSLRAKYLGYIRDIASNWLAWSKLEPIAKQYYALIAADVKTDTRKLYSTEAFEKGLTEETTFPKMGPSGGSPHMSMKQFVEERQKFLLEYKEPVKN